MHYAQVNQRHGRKVSSASFHKSRCPQMHVTAQNTNHIEHSLNVLGSRSELAGVATDFVPLLSFSIVISACSSWAELESDGASAFLRRNTAIKARHALARLRRQLMSSAEHNKSTRVRRAKIHRMCTLVGAWVMVVLSSLLVVSASRELRYKLNQCVKYMTS
jgi:hypothetical protein